MYTTTHARGYLIFLIKAFIDHWRLYHRYMKYFDSSEQLHGPQVFMIKNNIVISMLFYLFFFFNQSYSSFLRQTLRSGIILNELLTNCIFKTSALYTIMPRETPWTNGTFQTFLSITTHHIEVYICHTRHLISSKWNLLVPLPVIDCNFMKVSSFLLI